MSSIGERIKNIRKQKGISQASLAKNLCSQSNISRIEKDIYTPSLFLLNRFAYRLDVELEYLYSGNSGRNFEEIKLKLYQYLYRRKYSEIKEILDNYDEDYPTLYEMKTVYWMKAIIEDQLHSNTEAAKRYISNAISLVPEVDDYYLEIGILNSYALIYKNELDDKKVKQIYNEIFEKINSNNIKGELPVKILLSMAFYYYHAKNYENVFKFSAKAIKILNNDNSMYLLDYHLYNFASSLYYLDKNKGLDEEKIQIAESIAKYNSNQELLDTIKEFRELVAAESNMSN